MKYLFRIHAVILFLFIGMNAEDSHTAIMRYLQSPKFENERQAVNSAGDKPVKSLMIHPDERESLLGAAVYTRPELTDEQTYTSPDGHFMIHYTLTGYDGVDETSTNVEGVPDFVYEAGKSAEYVYRLLIDTLGFDPPPVDSITCPETDIYMINLGGRDYAYTYPENLDTTTSRPYDYTAYIEIDNDYKESGYLSNGLDGLHVTIAHEYFHVVQMGYNWFFTNDLVGSNMGDTYFLEWSSTWFEERAYPEVNDYLGYISDFFNYPMRSIWYFSQWNNFAYALGTFIGFLNQKYEDALIQKTWEKIKEQYALNALIDVIEEYNGNLPALYNEFIRRCYYSGDRYNEEYAISSDAKYFPELSINENQYQDNMTLETTINPMASRPYSISFDVAEYIYLNIDDSQLTGSLYGSYVVRRNNSQDNQQKFANKTEIFVGEIGAGNSLVVFITNPSLEEYESLSMTLNPTDYYPTEITALYANPYSWINEQPLNVQFFLGEFTEKLNVRIYNILGQRVYFESVNTDEIYPGLNDILINSDELRGRNLSSGIYFLRLTTDKKVMTHKFTIIK